ncbi:hypothetical protein KIF53_15975 [Chromobacterium subtsugae]|uniref:Wadjet protein JetD C-terminal domain-containing protein n=1 Tax=Chromobacterium subtsugae TaxID=251747 RepID=A0ABS7FGG3_9NEIS|nr:MULTISPECIES: Wadjet anti-phage system protein JetD domain-containing protein [Chromobacterium]KUM03718.1 hypothetical protein Cv017_18280 [Chromobacterium subtsugae]KZE85688.1 hypothetical protein AWB61_18570 [Chromobacterium sp. F49]MBW7567905.1 hypothetical protein [Chromobacterium subtsugae]MBW8289132.1 hypothetical protein [Chromobacterium subtsugae]WSE92615.1 Wadjet anti-phage system protein JetD domain-containing protein [Chromobacterium subtsugae]
MRWDDDKLRALALNLLLQGEIRRAVTSAPLIEHLDDLGIVIPIRERKDIFQLVPVRLTDYRHYLAVRWPDYAIAEAHFTGLNEKASAAGLRELRREHLDLPTGIKRLNRKTWSAFAGAHSKSRETATPTGVTLTTDDLLRARVNDGLCLQGPSGEYFDLTLWQRLTTEVILPERAFDAEWQFIGTFPDFILTVENLGTFVDLPKPPGCLLLHSPGWNTALASRLIGCLPSEIPWVHFGDLDPNGIRIPEALEVAERHPVFWIPDATAVVVDTHSLPFRAPWPDCTVLSHPTLLRLKETQRWLEQETIILTPEFAVELAELSMKLHRVKPME